MKNFVVNKIVDSLHVVSVELVGQGDLEPSNESLKPVDLEPRSCCVPVSGRNRVFSSAPGGQSSCFRPWFLGTVTHIILHQR